MEPVSITLIIFGTAVGIAKLCDKYKKDKEKRDTEAFREYQDVIESREKDEV